MARLLSLLALGFCGLFIGLPLLAMLSATLFDRGDFTLTAYGSTLQDAANLRKLLYSLELGFWSTTTALLLGGGHAWLTTHSDLPAARWLGPLGVAPLVLPPILVAMGFADLAWLDASGFWLCALLLGVAYAPFVAVLCARGLRCIDGRLYESALLARGRWRAELLLLRMILPELAAGCLLAFVFVLSEHGVPEFLTVKGKTWHTYAEGIFSAWTRRAVGMTHQDIQAPVVLALPLLLVIVICIGLALRLRARPTQPGDFRPLPLRRLGRMRLPGLLVPAAYLTCGVLLPVLVMLRWAAGSTQVIEPMSLAYLRGSFRAAMVEAGDDLQKTIIVAMCTALLVVLISLPLARLALRRSSIEVGTTLGLAMPAILLSMGLVHVYNHPALASLYNASFDFYDSWAMLICGYAARLLPFAVLPITQQLRRLPSQIDDAARLSGRSRMALAFRVWLPLSRPAIWSAACLIFILALRELDVAVVLTAGNGTVVRRLSNIVHFGGEDMGGALALLLLFAATIIPLFTVLLTGRKLTSLS